MAQQYLDKTGLSYFWGKIKSLFIKGNVGGVFYGTCSTAAATAAKVVECDAFTADSLKAGTIIVVTFSATNSGAVANLTMNVNGTGAKPIKYINNGTLGNLSSAGYLKANTEYPFYYDGANWVVWFNYNTTYSALSEADMHAGTATTARTITAQRLKQAVEYHAPVTSVNGQTGAVTINAPTATSELTNDSDYLVASVIDDYLTPEFYATDATSQTVMSQMVPGGTPEIVTPMSLILKGLYAIFYGLNPRYMYGWMNGTELELARLEVSLNTQNSTLTLYLRGRTSIATGKIYLMDAETSDTSWTVTPIANAPTKVSELTNDSGYLTLADLPIYNGGVQ